MTTNSDNIFMTTGRLVVTPLATYVVPVLVLINHEGKTREIQWAEFQEVAVKHVVASWILRDSWLGMLLCSKNMSMMYKLSFNVVLPKHLESCEILDWDALMIKEVEHGIQVINVVDR